MKSTPIPVPLRAAMRLPTASEINFSLDDHLVIETYLNVFEVFEFQ